MINQKNLLELNTGDDILHFLIVTKVEVKTARNGKSYLNLELRDKSVVLPAKVWDNFDVLLTKLSEGSIVKVAGSLEEFGGQPQIKIDKIRLAEPADNVTHEEFLPKSARDLEVMKKELSARINAINDNNLKNLVNNILSGDAFEKFLKAPAGKGWHHAYIHGLLEHTLEIIKICDLMCDFHSEVNRDLVVCGALLHDFGKTEELTFESTFDYSDKGKLLGHIVIAAMLVDKKASEIKDFPTDTKNQLIHLILSHQGKLEFASPVVPKTLEAIILYQADELSAKTNAYKSAINAEKGKGASWTKYLPLAETSLYIPSEEKNDFPKETLFDN